MQKLALIIEVDGSSNDHPDIQKHDKERQHKLEEAEFTVLRFTNDEVLKNMDSVCRRIDEEIVLLQEK